MRSTRLQEVAADEAESFSLIGDESAAQPPTPKTPKDTAALEARLSGLIVTALRTLSQRTLVAISNLFSLILAGAAFTLWWRALPAPTVPQLIGLGMFSCFVLALDFVRRR